MDHVLARIRGVNIEDIKAALAADAGRHAQEGLVFRHIWQNADDRAEILFIFSAADLDRAKKYIENAHAEVREANPDAPMPEMLFLKGE